MKGSIILFTKEAGKQIVLVAGVAQNILVCNIDDNTDPVSFTYNSETGEATILNRCVVEISGMLHLVTTTDESADVTINLFVNGVQEQILYTGITNQRMFTQFVKGFEKDDVLEFSITGTDDVTLETTDTQHYITIKRIH